MWMLPLYLHVNQKSDYDNMMAGMSVLTVWIIPVTLPGELSIKENELSYGSGAVIVQVIASVSVTVKVSRGMSASKASEISVANVAGKVSNTGG